MLERYRQAKVAIVVESLFSEGGDWRSIYFYAKHLEARGEPVVVIQPSGRRGFRQFVAAAHAAPRLIVNGLTSLRQWPVLLACWLRPDIRIYLHETAYMLDAFAREHPWQYRLLRRVLERNPVLCVSQQAEALYRKRFSSQQTHVVYECPGFASEPVELEPAKKHIVMVGSLNQRKGVELFSQAADLAAEAHPDWQFHWIGASATMEPLYQSSRVEWHGWQWSPQDIVRQCDLFLLSSVDDPCPLSALEAMAGGKRIVAYRETGISELIDGVAGCAIFEIYSAEDCLQRLADAFAASVPADEIRIRFAEKASSAAFTQRLGDTIAS